MAIANDVVLGPGVSIHHPELVNMYGCEVGEGSTIGPFVEVQRGVSIGSRCKISSHSFLCEGVVLEDGVFVGHGVMFTNDRYPRATTESGALQTAEDWAVIPTRVCERASIGSGAVILCGVTIGRNAMIGAGAVVTEDVAADSTVAGVPARVTAGRGTEIQQNGTVKS